MTKTLLLGSGTQALAIAKDLHDNGSNVFILANERHNYGDDSKYLTKVYFIDSDCSDDDYLSTVLSIIQDNSIDTIIPMGDANALFMSAKQDILIKYVQFEMPSEEIFERGYNKDSLMKYCSENGFPHPSTINDVDDISKIDVTQLKFPILIKPNHTCGGRGMTLVHNAEQLKRIFPSIYSSYGKCHLQEYIKPGGRQVEVQLYISEKGELKYSSVISKFRWYPVNGGSSCCAESIVNDNIVNILHKLLVGIGWVGFADFDTIEDPDTHELLIMELNPRVPACVRTAIVSGIHWGTIIQNEYLKKEQPSYKYSPGKILKHIGLEILWFIKSPKRFSTSPAILKFWGRNVYYQDLIGCDFKPFFCGLINNIKKLTNSDFRKSKQGTN